MKSLLASFAGGGLVSIVAIVAVLYLGVLDKPAVDQAAKVETVAPVASVPIATTPGEVRATAFVLVDAEGRTRGQFYTTPGGAVNLGLAGTHGEPRILLGVNGDKSRLLVTGADSKATVGISVFGSAPSVVLNDANGTTRSMLATMPGGGQWLTLSDEGGNDVWSTDRR